MSAIATIHVGLKSLGIDEDDARDLYEKQTGLRSLRQMSPRQHEAIVGELRRLGFNAGSRANKTRVDGPYGKKLQALWIAAWNLGLVRDRRDAALLAFVERQTGIESIRFLRAAADARKAVEALKSWIARAAGVDWTDKSSCDGERVAWAQFRQIIPGATRIGNAAQFRAAIARILRHQEPPSDREWQAVMNHFGRQIRSLKKAAA